MSQNQGQSLEAASASISLCSPLHFFHHKILLSPGTFIGFWASSILIAIAFSSAEFEYF